MEGGDERVVEQFFLICRKLNLIHRKIHEDTWGAPLKKKVSIGKQKRHVQAKNRKN